MCLSWEAGTETPAGESPGAGAGGGEQADSRFKNVYGKEKASGKCLWVLKTD